MFDRNSPRRTPINRCRLYGTLAAVAAMGLVSCSDRREPDPAAVKPQPDLATSLVRVAAAEDLILALEPQINRLSRSAMNLDMGDPRARELFEPMVRVRDVEPQKPATPAGPPVLGVTFAQWMPAASETDAPRDQLSLLRPILEQIRYFEHAKFYFVSATLAPGDGEFNSLVGFSGLARALTGRLLAVDGRFDVRWRKHRDPKNPDPGWLIAGWSTKEMRSQEAGGLMFEDVLDDALPMAAQRNHARRSIPEELLLEVLLKTPRDQVPKMPPGWSSFMHPGVAVVDLDRDGLDDLYVTPMLGKAMLLRNRGDGTFVDIAPAVGLDVENYTTSAIFADFDNDGDPDVFLGRTIERSMYLENVKGRFVDRSREAVDVPLPMLVSSVSAADYDGDGLLDVYFSTYGADVITRDAREFFKGNKKLVLDKYLSEADARRLWEILEKTFVPYLNFAGPPNILLRNVGGGRFQEAGEKAGARLFKNTFQATWGDYDKDGDPDLYCANDFSANNLLRNDGGVFTDVSLPAGVEDQGFGMGAAFGDYDNDGRQDLYVSNMYSKAGLRITKDLPGIDPGLARSARGNTLFRNRGTGFEIVSAPDGPLRVHQAGWSWGGQFADLDNDGWLDIYVASGFYTAPKEVEQPGDL